MMVRPSFDYRFYAKGVSAAIFALAGVSHGPLSAQEAQGSQDSQPGSLLVLRDVPYGTALPRPAKGEALEVQTGPDRILLPAISQGLRPLTSDEQATVFASSQMPIARLNSTIADQLHHAEVAIGANLAQQHGQSAGGIVASAIAQIPSVGTIVRGAMGDGQ